MELVRGLGALPLDRRPAVVTVGFFDGVHLGHRKVLERVVQVAAERGLRSVAVTFDRHPREILRPGTEPRLLTTVERKADLISALGIDTLVVLAFDRDLSTITAPDFVAEVLVGGLHAEHAVMGTNFTFGYRAEGTMSTLPGIAEPFGMTVDAADLVELDGRAVSSTSIREALAAGDLSWPTRALGRRFVLDGEVVYGHGRGTDLGYPTANLQMWPRLLLPGRGIYAGAADVNGSRYRAAIDVGTNPTFGVDPLHAEAFLLGFEGELHGRPLSLELWERLRDEERYDDVETLVAAIAHDVERTRAIVSL